MKTNFLSAPGEPAQGAERQAPGETPGEEAAEARTETAGKSNELCVPVSALAMPDEQEQMTNPEAGDVVNLQVEAKVDRIEGEEAYVIPQSVNGQELKAQSAKRQAPSPEEQDQAEYGQLQEMARQQPIG